MRLTRHLWHVVVAMLVIILSFGPGLADDRNNQPPQWKDVTLPDAEQDTRYSFNLTVTDPDHNLSELDLTDDCPLFNITDDANFNFTPRNADVGWHTFNVTATDPGGLNDTMELDLFVVNVNDPPTMDRIPLQFAAVDHVFTLDVSQYVDDPDLHIPKPYRDRLTYRDDTTKVDTNVETGVCIWDMPTEDDLGDFYFKVTVQDSKGRYDEQEIQIRVIRAGAPIWERVELPDAVQDRPYSFNLTVNDPDDPLSNLTLSDDSPLFNISATGGIAFTPGNMDVGTHRFNVTAEDPIRLRDTMELVLAVQNVNDPPTLRPIPRRTVEEDRVLNVDLSVYADDPDLHIPGGARDVLTYSVNSSNLAIGPVSGLLTWYYPEDVDVGVHAFNVSVTDEGGLQASQVLVVEVVNVNDPPVLEPLGWQHLVEDVPYSMVVVVNDGDLLVPGTNESHTFSNDPRDHFVTNATTGLIDFTPGDADVGTWEVTVTVTDRAGANDSVTIVFEVENVNDPPSIVTAPPNVTDEDVLYKVAFKASDPDPEDNLTWGTGPLPAWLTFDLGTALLFGTPTNDDVGEHTVNMWVEDLAGEVAWCNLTLTVRNVNDPPEILTTEDSYDVAEFVQLFLQMDAIDPDVGDALRWSIETDHPWMEVDGDTGLVQVNTSGVDLGRYELTVSVADGNGGSDSLTIALTVYNVNDPPGFLDVAPPPQAIVGDEYTFLVQVTDPDLPYGDVLTLRLTQHPLGMVLDEGTGLVTWTPSLDQTGFHSVDVEVADQEFAVDLTWSVQVIIPADNVPPSFASQPPLTRLKVGASFVYDVSASDPEDQANLSLDLVEGPDGMDLDPGSWRVSWTAAIVDVGDHVVTIRVSDGRGGSGTQTFTLRVVRDEGGNGGGPMTLIPYLGIVVLILAVVAITYGLWRARRPGS